MRSIQTKQMKKKGIVLCLLLLLLYIYNSFLAPQFKDYHYPADVISELESECNVPVYLPELYNNPDSKYFFIEAAVDADSYSLNIYRSAHYLDANNEKDYILQNGHPISESDFICSIAGENERVPFHSAEEVEQNPVSSWEWNGWTFQYVGQENIALIDQLKAEFSSYQIPFADKGSIHIFEGNRYFIEMDWDMDKCHYSFTSYFDINDISSLFQQINSINKL